MLCHLKLEELPENLSIHTRRYFTDGNLQALVRDYFGEDIPLLEKGPVYVFSDMPYESEKYTLDDFISKGNNTIAFVYHFNKTAIKEFWEKLDRDKDLIKELVDKQSRKKSD